MKKPREQSLSIFSSNYYEMIQLKNKLNKCQIVAYLLIIFFSFLLVDFSVNAYVQQSIEVYVYTVPETSKTELAFSYFNNKSHCVVIFHGCNNSVTSERFLKIVNILVMQGVVATPSCLPCESSDVTWEEIWMAYATPLIAFFHDGKLKAITVGVTDYKVLDKALVHTLDSTEGMEISTSYEVYSLTDEGITVRLKDLFIGRESSDTIEINFLNLASFITLLALADSVNPCTFAVFTALLLMALYSLGRIKTAATGLSFILAIFIGYYALGLGLFRILVYIPSISKIVAVTGLVIGAFTITYGLKPEFKSPVPKFLRGRMDLWISKSYTSPIASFVLGLVASFTLLPCSSGPYLVGLGLLSTLRDSIQIHFLLTLYNAIFVLPLIIILVALLASSSLLRKIKAFRSSKLGVMELTMGIILVLVCMYLLLS